MSCGYHQCLAVYVVVFLGISMLLPPVACVVNVPSSLSVRVGKDAVLMWNTTDGILSASWGLKDASSDSMATTFIYTDIVTPPTSITSTAYKGRVSFVGNLTAGHAWFKIIKLKVSDTNTYGADIREVGHSTPKFSSVNLQVTVPPQFTPAPPSSITIKEGDNMSIQCSAKGPSTPQVKWLHNGNILSQGQGSATLNIVNIKRSQSGTYQCQASNNPNEQPAKTTTHLTVYYKPSIDKASSTNNICSWKGNTITLQCVVASGLPSPNFTWYKPNGDVIPCNQCSRTVSSQVTVQTGQDSGDYGPYRCIATNVVGSDQHYINVTQFCPPSSPEVKADINETSVTLVWSKPDENGGEITKYTIYMKVVVMDFSWSKVGDVTATSYTVEDLDPGKKYSFIVTAINQYGESLKDDSKAKSVVIPVVTTTAITSIVVEPTKEKSESTACSKVTSTVVGVLAAFLAVSLLVIVLLVLYIWRITRRTKTNQRKTDSLSFENAVEMAKTSSSSAATLYAPPASQPDVEYESVEPSRVQPQYETPQSSGKYEIPDNRQTSQDPSHYQHLNPSTRNEIPDNTPISQDPSHYQQLSPSTTNESQGSTDNRQTSENTSHYQQLNPRTKTAQHDDTKGMYEPFRLK